MKMRLTIPEAKNRIDEINGLVERRDYEAAEGAEHSLWEDVLESIRNGSSQPKGLANVALATKNIDFPRGWGG
jgi:hypothetical protein